MPARRRGGSSRSFRGYDRYDGYGSDFPEYVSVAERRANARRTARALEKKGRALSPVEIPAGRKIATTFWGSAWCNNLERYGDFANRIPRGRTYVRNGSVIDLQITPGKVEALVSGSSIYSVQVGVAPASQAKWKSVCARCAGGIDSLVELLQGRFSKGVMEHLCEQGTGLFPTPREIQFSCSCPDIAMMCKHIAAVLYGVGARLDHQPELLFRLRKVNEQDLLAKAGQGLAQPKDRAPAGNVLAAEDLASVFGIELADLGDPSPSSTPKSKSGSKPASKSKGRPAAKRRPVAAGKRRR
jgi:uncharacterized Zn finger protein